jgi:hypothetical protein
MLNETRVYLFSTTTKHHVAGNHGVKFCEYNIGMNVMLLYVFYYCYYFCHYVPAYLYRHILTSMHAYMNT